MRGRPTPMTGGRRLLVGLGIVLAAVALVPAVTGPAVAQQPGSQTVEVRVPSPRPTLRWGINPESNGGIFVGGCNLLSAGIAGDTGGSRVWTPDDGFYRAEDGNVRIEKPDADGRYVTASWETRCLDRHGRQVTVADLTSTTEAQVVIRDGERHDDPASGVTTFTWQGSFTVAFYGGMTYWSASDPVLRVHPDGRGQLTATLSGYGSDRDDLSRWVRIPPRQVVLADLSDIELGASGFAVVPDYVGVTLDLPGAEQAPRDEVNAPYWGSFPRSFVEFQLLTGQAAYWFASNGMRDPAKPPVLLEVLYGHEPAVPPGPGPGSGGGAGGGGAGGGGGSGGGGGVTPPPVTPPPVTPPPVTPPPVVGEDQPDDGHGEAMIWPALLAQTVFGAAGRGLVPDVVASVVGPLTTTRLLGLAGALSAGSVLVVLWRRGALVLPWSRRT